MFHGPKLFLSQGILLDLLLVLGLFLSRQFLFGNALIQSRVFKYLMFSSSVLKHSISNYLKMLAGWCCSQLLALLKPMGGLCHMPFKCLTRIQIILKIPLQRQKCLIHIKIVFNLVYKIRNTLYKRFPYDYVLIASFRKFCQNHMLTLLVIALKT